MADFLEKLKKLRLPWREISPPENTLPDVSPDLSSDHLDLVKTQMHNCLDAKGGEVSARQRAAQLGQAYLGLNEVGRKKFLKLLADDFCADQNKVEELMRKLHSAQNETEKREIESDLRRALEPARMQLLKQFNALPDGVKFLVDLRAELLKFSREDASLKIVESDLKDILISWFDVGFLELRRLTWDSPASVLEKIAEYEAVHSIQSWSDLKNRLARDRRLYGFFHPRMPNEPLIFVEVALVNGISDNVMELLDEEAPLLDPAKADTAIFYSISNAQAGLAGISFGNFLIKKVVGNLSTDLPNIKTFSTLSPIPGFMKWLEGTMAEGDSQLLLSHERDVLKELSGQKGAKGGLKVLLESKDWHKNVAICEALKGPLMRLAARYLTEAKRKGTRTLDPVAHFHLSNGARMERLNWLGDTSEKGMKQAGGLMINYLYRLSDIETNHEDYRSTGKIATSSTIKSLLKG